MRLVNCRIEYVIYAPESPDYTSVDLLVYIEPPLSLHNNLLPINWYSNIYLSVYPRQPKRITLCHGLAD